ncbi:MAG: hypothetical protein KGJ21_06390 [Pseudomonadota bacterium]|nr:hypothetical protein [Pseudomonadota bacterium]
MSILKNKSSKKRSPAENLMLPREKFTDTDFGNELQYAKDEFRQELITDAVYPIDKEAEQLDKDLQCVNDLSSDLVPEKKDIKKRLQTVRDKWVTPLQNIGSEHFRQQLNAPVAPYEIKHWLDDVARFVEHDIRYAHENPGIWHTEPAHYHGRLIDTQGNRERQYEIVLHHMYPGYHCDNKITFKKSEDNYIITFTYPKELKKLEHDFNKIGGMSSAKIIADSQLVVNCDQVDAVLGRIIDAASQNYGGVPKGVLTEIYDNIERAADKEKQAKQWSQYQKDTQGADMFRRAIQHSRKDGTISNTKK